MSSSVHVDNKKKDVLVLGEGPTQGLDGITLTAEKKYSISFTENNKTLFQHALQRSKSLFFVIGTEITKFKVKDSEIVAIPLCLGNISKDFSAENLKKQD